jgi:hypothetical protein
MTTSAEDLTTPDRFQRRALFAFRALAREEQAEVLATLGRISEAPPRDWTTSYAHRLAGEQPAYLIRVNDSLRVIVQVEESGQLVVHDLVRRDTLKTFGALQDVP